MTAGHFNGLLLVMADPITPPAEPITPAPATPPADPAKPTEPTITPDDIKGKTPEEIIKLVVEKSESLGTTKKEKELLQDYYNQVQPYIETIVGDQDLAKLLAEKHATRTGQPLPNTETKKPDEEKKDDFTRDDNRKALENQIITSFEREKGIDRLDGETKKELSVRVGQELMEMLDPAGSKSYQEVLGGISLTKLNRYLDKAYNLATMDEKLQKVKEMASAQAQSGQAGIIGSMPSSSTSEQTTTLGPREKQWAKNMGISEVKWLQNKQQIIDRENQREST